MTMPSARADPRPLIAWTIVAVAVAVFAAWALYVVRQVLLLIYVSLLLAIGFSPLVRLIERQSVLRIGTHIPRWLAILIIYVVVLAVLTGIAFVVVPPFVTQAQGFAAHAPALLERGQRWLIGHGVLHETKSFGDIVRQAPAGGDV